METTADKSHNIEENLPELFKNKMSLETLTTPHGAKLIGRDGELAQLFRLLSPSQNGGHVVPFISVHGKSGTGKSAVVEVVCKSLEQDGLLLYRFVNLRRARTVFGCANTILHALGSIPLKSADGMSLALER